VEGPGENPHPNFVGENKGQQYEHRISQPGGAQGKETRSDRGAKEKKRRNSETSGPGAKSRFEMRKNPKGQKKKPVQKEGEDHDCQENTKLGGGGVGKMIEYSKKTRKRV